MLHKPEKRGRPPGPKLEQADAEYIKEQIRQEEGWHILAVFYRDVFEWNKRKKYRRFKKPKDVVSVESAFMAWFSGKRPLPKLYESILDELLGNWRDDLPSRRTSANAKGGESAWAPLDRAPEIKTLAATAAPVPGRIKIHAKIWPDGNMEVSCYDLATDRWEDYLYAREQARDVNSIERDRNRNLRTPAVALLGHFDGVVGRIAEEQGWRPSSAGEKPAAQQELSNKIEFLQACAAAALNQPVPQLNWQKDERLRDWINHPRTRRFNGATSQAITSDFVYSELRTHI